MNLASSRLALVGLLALVGAATASGHLYTTDGVIQYRVAVSLASGSGFAVDEPEEFRAIDYGGRTGTDGRYYAQFAPALSLLYLPSVFVERAVGAPPGLLAALSNLPVWILLVLLYETAVLRRGAAPASARAAALLLAFASPLLVYAKQDFAEPIAAAGLLLLAETLLIETPSARDLLRAGAGLLIASLARAECATAGLSLAAFALSTSLPVSRRATALAAAALPSLSLLAYNLLRFGNALDFGLPATGANEFRFSLSAAATAAYGLFLSPNKGLVFYFPAVLLLAAAPRRAVPRAAALRLALLVLPYLAVHLSWHSWMGGWSWGPRRLVPLLPILCLPLPAALERIAAAARPLRVTAAALVVLSIVVQSLGVLVDFGKALTYAAPWRQESHPAVPKRDESKTWLDPGHTPLLDHLRLAQTGERDFWYESTWNDPSPAKN